MVSNGSDAQSAVRRGLAALCAALAVTAAGCGGGDAAVATTATEVDAAAESAAGPSAGPVSAPTDPVGSLGKPGTPGTMPLVPSSKTAAALKTLLEDMTLPSDDPTADAGAADAPAAKSADAAGGVLQSADAFVQPLAGPTPSAVRRATIVMGANPRGSATPAHWTPADPGLKSDGVWNAVAAGFALRVGAGDAATNTAVQIRNVTAWWLSRSTGRWMLLGASAAPALTEHAAQDPSQRRREILPGAGWDSVTIRPEAGWAIRGRWLPERLPIAAADIAEIVVSVDARLVVLDSAGPDDRAAARYLLRSWAEYWPQLDTTLDAFAPMTVNPGAGHGRYKRVTSQWQSFYFATAAASELPGNPPPITVPF
ncbi:MAG TPA: hypothetical protein VM491_20535 [Burkholderiaceae bacterium]|nr:hypothetical protein [Burkholderiaceae bacterium]